MTDLTGGKITDTLNECRKYIEMRLLSPEMSGHVDCVKTATKRIIFIVTKKFEALGPEVAYLINDDLCEAYKEYFFKECDNIFNLYFEHINGGLDENIECCY